MSIPRTHTDARNDYGSGEQKKVEKKKIGEEIVVWEHESMWEIIYKREWKLSFYACYCCKLQWNGPPLLYITKEEWIIGEWIIYDAVKYTCLLSNLWGGISNQTKIEENNKLRNDKRRIWIWEEHKPMYNGRWRIESRAKNVWWSGVLHG